MARILVATDGSQFAEHAAREAVRLFGSDHEYSVLSVAPGALAGGAVAITPTAEVALAPEAWEEHELVVINPDGFQGDERDVIVYSLSYDARVMSQAINPAGICTPAMPFQAATKVSWVRSSASWALPVRRRK